MVNSQDVEVGACYLETDSCPKSTVDINSKMELENVPTSGAKRKRRRNRRRKKMGAPGNDVKDGRHSADSDSVKSRATEMESMSERPTSICLRNESGMEQPMAKINSSVGKSRRKKRKARHDALDNKLDNNLHVANGDHSEKEELDSFLQPLINNCSKNESETIAEVRLPTKRRKNKKRKHNTLGSNLDHDPTVTEEKHSERQDFKSVPEVAESNLDNVKACKFDNNGVGTLSVERVELKTCRREQIDEKKEKMKTYQRKKRKSAEQLENGLKEIEVAGRRQFSDDARIPGLPENEIKKLRMGGQVPSMNCLELEEASANYFDGALLREKSKKRNKKKSFKVTTHEKAKDVNLQDAAEDNFEKESMGNGDKIEMTTLRKSYYPGSTKKKLLILDLNGILVDIVQRNKCSSMSDIIVSGKSVFERPFCDEFLQFCFERFNVGVWSSRMKKNVDRVVNIVMQKYKRKLLFRWDQSHCTATGFMTLENKGKPLLLKELKKLWEKVVPQLPWEKGEYNESNTLLLDDSPYKALCNPEHTAIFPRPYNFRNNQDCSLGPGGDIRVYLEGLASADNVQTYVQQNPFGQRPITESHRSWDFYYKVKNAKPV